MSSTSRQLVKTTHAIAKATGMRFCTKCNLTRPTEGGKTVLIANKRTRWECASCAARRSPSGYASKKGSK